MARQSKADQLLIKIMDRYEAELSKTWWRSETNRVFKEVEEYLNSKARK
jgi:hypothetical protein